jgi:hypothetical protein
MMDPRPKLRLPTVQWSDAQWKNFEAFLDGSGELSCGNVSEFFDAARAACGGGSGGEPGQPE